MRDLSLDQPVRKIMDSETHGKIQVLIDRLRDVLEEDEEFEEGVEKAEWKEGDKKVYDKGEKPIVPFTLKLDDPAGNSFIQFLGSSNGDIKWSMRAYPRTKEQNIQLGLVSADEEAAGGEGETSGLHHMGTEAEAQAEALASHGTDEQIKGRDNMMARDDGTAVPEEVFSFPGSCSSCGHELETLMQKVNIPYFKVSQAE